MDAPMSRVFILIIVFAMLSACGSGGNGAGADPNRTGVATSDESSGSTAGSNASGNTATDGGTNSAGGTTNSGSSSGSSDSGGSTGDSSGSTTSGSSGSSGTETPGRITINLPFTCPADQSSITGCWVSEVCTAESGANSSYRNVLMFTTDKHLNNMFVHWGEPGCPAEQTPSVTQVAAVPDYAVGAEVDTTSSGVIGHLLDLDTGKTKTVFGDIPQLQNYGVQRICFHVGHYIPATGIVANVQRAGAGPYVIDNTLCLQRHLN